VFAERVSVFIAHIDAAPARLPRLPPCDYYFVYTALFARQQWACEQSNMLIKNGESVACIVFASSFYHSKAACPAGIRDEAKMVRFNISEKNEDCALAANLFMPSDKYAPLACFYYDECDE